MRLILNKKTTHKKNTAIQECLFTYVKTDIILMKYDFASL